MLRIAPIALLLACSVLFAADAPVYEQRAVHDPDGIGKFYLDAKSRTSWDPAESSGWNDRNAKWRNNRNA